MFKKYFEEYKNEINYHRTITNIGPYYNYNVQLGINDQLNNIKYIEEVLMKMSEKEQREHFCYIRQYKDDYKDVKNILV